MLKEDDRYKSMGCILVSDDVLDVLLEILRKSKDGMRVMTTYGFDERIVNGESLNEWLAEKSATEIRLAQKN
jgi:hypothetical protein